MITWDQIILIYSLNALTLKKLLKPGDHTREGLLSTAGIQSENQGIYFADGKEIGLLVR